MPEFFRHHDVYFFVLSMGLGVAALKLLAANSWWCIAPILAIIALAKMVDDGVDQKEQALRFANEALANRRNRRVR